MTLFFLQASLGGLYRLSGCGVLMDEWSWRAHDRSYELESAEAPRLDRSPTEAFANETRSELQWPASVARF